jgi:hypothetical protein
MNRMKLLLLGVLTAGMILGSSLVIAGQPADDAASGDPPVVGGGLGRYLKR